MSESEYAGPKHIRAYTTALIPEDARDAGDRLFRESRVTPEEAGPDWINFRVRDRGDHWVSVPREVEHREWPGTCSCTTYRRHRACEHLWATVLWLDRWARAVTGTLGTSLQVAGLDSDARPEIAADTRHDDLIELEAVADLVEPPESGEGVWAGFAPRRQRIVYALDLQTNAVGDPEVEVCILRQQRLKNGDWGKPKPVSIPSNTNAWATEDAPVFSILEGAEPVSSAYRYYSVGDTRGCKRFQLSPHLAKTLLPEMCATGRLFATQFDLTRPLEMDHGASFELVLRLRTAAGGESIELCGILRRGDEEVPLRNTQVLGESGYCIRGQSLSRLRSERTAPVAELLGVRHLEVPADRIDRLRRILTQLGVPVEDPNALLQDPERAPIETALIPEPRLQVRQPESSRRALSARIEFRYGEQTVDAGARRSTRGNLARNFELERQRLGEFISAGGVPEPQGADHGVIPEADFPSLASELLESGWQIEAEGLPVRRSKSCSMSVASGIDWFELKGAASFDDQRLPLPELLRAIRKRTRMVRLGDGSQGILPSDWLEKFQNFELLQELGQESGESIRLERQQGWLLDAMLAARPDVEVELDETFAKLTKKFAQIESIEAAPTPSGFGCELRPYQSEGVGWMQFLGELGLGGCLADDMGLGKTVQVLALLEGQRQSRTKRRRGGPRKPARPSLIVAPRSVISHWRLEAERFAPDLTVLDFSTPDRWDHAGQLARTDLVLTTYGLLRRDAPRLAEQTFHYLVLDEAQAIKNERSQAARAARLCRADHRLALSGTPVENHLGELWSLFEFLNPGMLGRSKVFKEAFAQTKEQKALASERRGVLRQALRPFFLRRRKDQVLDDLPEKSEQVIHLELSKKQRKEYDQLRKHYRRELLDPADGPTKSSAEPREKLKVLEALLRLRQAACHPGLLDASRRNEDSAKLDALLSHLQELTESGHKTLVFSQFTTLLSIVRDRLDEQGVTYEYLDGQTRKRQERIDRFQQDPAIPVFLISLKAGGVGLNLTAASYVILLDPWWNPAAESQAIDRTHRIGQTQRVTAYRLIATDTVEERVLELQNEKRELADAIFGEDMSLIRDLTRKDLERLLR